MLPSSGRSFSPSRSVAADEGLARLVLPLPFRAEPEQGWLLHPALMDLATGWAMELIAGYAPDHLWVPVGYDSIRVLRPLPADIVSHVRNAADNRASRATARFDVTLATPEGEVCVEIEGFTIRRLEGGLAFPRPEAREMQFDGGGAARGGARRQPPVQRSVIECARSYAILAMTIL